MIKKRAILCLSVILTVVLAAGVEMFWLSRQKTVKEYKESQVAFGNPLMGYARNAWYDKVSEDISLLYMGKALLQIITIRRSFPVMSRQ